VSNQKPLLPGARKKKPTVVEELRELKHRVHRLEHELKRQEHKLELAVATAAELTASVAALTAAVAAFPAPAPQLITQEELDAAKSGVDQAVTDLQAKVPPTP
jgi:Tfp pilus assembly protein FimV